MTCLLCSSSRIRWQTIRFTYPWKQGDSCSETSDRDQRTIESLWFGCCTSVQCQQTAARLQRHWTWGESGFVTLVAVCFISRLWIPLQTFWPVYRMRIVPVMFYYTHAKKSARVYGSSGRDCWLAGHSCSQRNLIPQISLKWRCFCHVPAALSTDMEGYFVSFFDSSSVAYCREERRISSQNIPEWSLMIINLFLWIPSCICFEWNTLVSVEFSVTE